MTWSVEEVWVFEGLVHGPFFVKGCVDPPSSDCEDGVEELVDQNLEDYLRTEHGEHPEANDGCDVVNVLDHDIVHKLGVLPVPLPAVIKSERGEETELSNHEIRHPSCIIPLYPSDRDSDIGSSDHVHIVGSISDGEGEFLTLGFDGVYDVLFLARGASVADCGVERDGEVGERERGVEKKNGVRGEGRVLLFPRLELLMR